MRQVLSSNSGSKTVISQCAERRRRRKRRRRKKKRKGGKLVFIYLMAKPSPHDLFLNLKIILCEVVHIICRILATEIEIYCSNFKVFVAFCICIWYNFHASCLKETIFSIYGDWRLHNSNCCSNLLKTDDTLSEFFLRHLL